MKTGYRWVIPGSELRPLMLEWGKRNGYQQGVSHGAPNGHLESGHMTLATVLSFRSGVPDRRIRGILNDNNESSNVTFDTADRLLCGMDMVGEWHGRLADYYAEPIEVGVAEVRRLNEKEKMDRDLRDPKIVGQDLIDMCEKQKEIQPSVLADLTGLPAADWTGDGHMSNDPALHHSQTSQLGNEKIEGQV